MKIWDLWSLPEAGPCFPLLTHGRGPVTQTVDMVSWQQEALCTLCHLDFLTLPVCAALCYPPGPRGAGAHSWHLRLCWAGGWDKCVPQ